MAHYQYLIVGGGMTADAAIAGIRQSDSSTTIGLIGTDPHPPYDRPPLSKALWKGTPLESIWRTTDHHGVDFHLGRTVRTVDPGEKRVTDDRGAIFTYEKVASVIGGNNPAGLTVSNAGASNSSITEAAYTGIGGGVASTSLHHTYALGANALALAEGRMRMGDRREDDYQQFIGRDADNIWGAARMDWLQADGTAGNNQGSAVFVNTILQ